MEFIGQIQGLNTRPITGYNQFLQGSASFDVKVDETEFDSILQAQTLKQKANSSTPTSLAGKIGEAFNGSLNEMNEKTEAANRLQEAFSMGEDVSVHEVMIAAEKSSLSMQMALQVRNKVIAAYNEINNIRI